MVGLIIKILSDKCFVKINEEVIVCTIRGKFRAMQLLPLVGDYVKIDKNKKVLLEILPRKNTIRRPPVSNITQAFIVTSLKLPDFSDNLLDKILVELEFNHIKPIICLTKKDLITDDEFSKISKIMAYYESIGYPVLLNTEHDKIKSLFKDEVTVFIGQTGAGKSSLLNKLVPNLSLSTGEVSKALGRGRHTTRHIEIFSLFGGMILDTPGFSSLEFGNMTKKEIRDSFIEFKNYPCPYSDCMHDRESECNVLKASMDGFILPSRIVNYHKFLLTGLEESEKYKRR